MAQFVKRFTAALFVGVMGYLASTGWAEDPAQRQARDIDLVICLDCSNSMDGLIDSARAKLWDIVNDFTKIKRPSPNLRVALYSYGNESYDAKNGWVRKELDFTTDLDLVSQKLFALKTNGGTEYVTRVCRDAIRDLTWSGQNDALKLIFVCGNEPASQDPVVSIKEVAAYARGRQIYVNPIFCGDGKHGDAQDWRQLAVLGGGTFATIDQNAAQVAIATPVDKQIADLGLQLNATYVYYGDAGKDKFTNQAVQYANSANIGYSSAASCTIVRCKNVYQGQTAHWDLVERLKTDPKLDIGKIPESQLSEAMRKLSAEKRLAYVKDMASKRSALQKQIAELETRREVYIAEQMRRQIQAQPALQNAITDSIRKQAAIKGFCY